MMVPGAVLLRPWTWRDYVKCVITQRHLHSHAARILDWGWGTCIVAKHDERVMIGLPAAAQDRLPTSGLIALLIGVILVARSRHSRGGTDAARPRV
jgi:hypothetical protein